MEIFVYSDESGVLDKVHNKYFGSGAKREVDDLLSEKSDVR